MVSLEEFHQDFLQSILSDADSRGLMKPQAFFENVCEELISTGDLFGCIFGKFPEVKNTLFLSTINL
jgi:hypothetical protein